MEKYLDVMMKEEVTVFKSVGLAIVDIVVAQYFYKKLNKLINHILYKNRYRISDNVAMADTVFYYKRKSIRVIQNISSYSPPFKNN